MNRMLIGSLVAWLCSRGDIALMSDLAFETATRMVSADGAAARLGAFASELGVRRLLLVTDRGVQSAGLLHDAMASCAGAGIGVVVFSDVEADPPEQCVQDAVAMARAEAIDGVVGFGGGSSLDCAKLVALLASGAQSLADVYGVNRARGTRLPLIQVPTTAGTGSEVTPIAIVTTPTQEKQGVVSPLLYPDIALLDATLTVGLPARVTAMTGIDAMVHAIEAFTSRHRKNAVSDSLALRALTLLSNHMRRVLRDGNDLPARRAMLQGSMLAGMAFANAPVAAVHALAYPVGGHFHVPHGLSNALVMMPVLRFNAVVAHREYAELSAALYDNNRAVCNRPSAGGFLEAMTALSADLGLERCLQDVGVTAADVPMLAHDAMKVQRLLVNNPRDVTLDDAMALYREAL